MNLRAGRGDRPARCASPGRIGMSQMSGGCCRRRTCAEPGAEFARFLAALGQALVIATFVWMLYVALEPWVRGFWPDSLKGWTRLLRATSATRASAAT